MPSGLQTDPQVTTIVGNDVRLTCRASKYIYSHLAWYYPSSEAALSDSVIKTTDNYSISLTLVITNITKEQSGLYKCRAQNQHNSTDTLEQHTQLLVRGRSCQRKMAVGHAIVLLPGQKHCASAAPFEAFQRGRCPAFLRDCPNIDFVLWFGVFLITVCGLTRSHTYYSSSHCWFCIKYLPYT